MKKRRISIFGATGSVGRSTLDLIARRPDLYDVVALSAGSDAAGLAELARQFGASHAVLADESRRGALADALAGTDIEVMAGEAELEEAARLGADWTMAAIVGCAGLRPTLAAMEHGGTVALANKESLVAAGDLMMSAARQSGTRLLPVDSEHNAIFQCLAGDNVDHVSRILLTASGGPFRTHSREEMEKVTPEQAVAHPNWSMGAKISVDSATMMNKGLELIEADHLFPVGLDKIEILVHPQSVIHSMVEYKDCSTLAQLGSPNMRIPIASALAWPDRIETGCAPLNLASVGRLDFEAPDEDRFPALRLARQAAKDGGARPAMLNAANEIAVAAFLERRIGFLAIAELVERALDRLDLASPRVIDDIFAIDAETRAHVRERVAATA